MTSQSEITRLESESSALSKSIKELNDEFATISTLERNSALAKFMNSFVMSFRALGVACTELDYEWDQRAAEDPSPRIRLKAELDSVGVKFKESEYLAEKLMDVTSLQRSKIEDIRQIRYAGLPPKLVKLNTDLDTAAKAGADEVRRLEGEIGRKTTTAQNHRKELDRLNAMHRKLLNEKRNTAFLQKILGKLKDTERELDGIKSASNTVAAEISSLTVAIEAARNQVKQLRNLQVTVRNLDTTVDKQSQELAKTSSTLLRSFQDAQAAHDSAHSCYRQVMECLSGIDDAKTSQPKKSIIIDSLLGVMRAAVGIRYIDSTSLEILENFKNKDDAKGSVRTILGINVQGLKEDIEQGFVSPGRTITIEGVEATLPRAS